MNIVKGSDLFREKEWCCVYKKKADASVCIEDGGFNRQKYGQKTEHI